MAQERLQSDHDVEQILKLAVRNAGFSDEEALRQRLQAAASELGLSEAQVKAAEEQYHSRKAAEAERQEYLREVKKEFWEHFATYVIVNAGLLALDLWKDGALSWAFWPIVGWGIGIGFHALYTFISGGNEDDKDFDRWRRKRRRRAKRGSRQVEEA